MEDDKSRSAEQDATTVSSGDNDHGWQKVTYAKKQSKKTKTTTSDDPLQKLASNGSAIVANGNTVFRGLEKHAEERRRKYEAQRAASAVYDGEDDEFALRSKRKSKRDDEDVDDESNSDGEVRVDNNAGEKKKEKQKKVKKPKVTVAEASSKIDANDLASFLSDISESYEGQQDIQLMRFADYFGRAFSGVSASQFPWVKLFRESAVGKIADVPVSNISESVYKTSVDWISQRSPEALENFVIWSLDSILADMAAQQPGSKGSKKGVQPASSKSQVAIFLVLAMTLRRKPDVLIGVLPKLRENSKYQGLEKLPVVIWMIVQACQGDLPVGLQVWSHYVLPMLGGKSGSNPQLRDLILQLVERILSAPRARGILVSNAVRRGERLIPPTSLDILLHVTFPEASARVKATERFEAIYPTLKDVALAGSPGSKAMRQVAQQIQIIAFNAAGEGTEALSEEAISIFLWSLTQSPECYKQWDRIYTDNIDASVAALRKLSENWKELSPKQSSLQALTETLKSFRQKNEEALSGGVDASRHGLFKEAEKHCKTMLSKLSSGHSCMKTVVLTFAVLALGAAFVSPNVDSLDWSKLTDLFGAYKSSF